MNAFLFIGTVLIWGTTWLAIAFQVGEVAVEVSVFYRFALATIIQVILLISFGKIKWVPFREHRWFVLQGWFLFCFNFLLFYNASVYTTSGLIAVVFSMATIFTLINAFLFHRQLPNFQSVAGAVLGMAGVCFIFWQDLIEGGWSSSNLHGLLLSIAGTYCFSLGNLVSQHQQKQGRNVITANTYALVYGSITLGLWCLFRGHAFEIDYSTRYLASLAYLIIPGTIVAFTLYLNLVGRVGADRAAYCTVLFPVVALSLSTVFENYQWTLLSLIGVALALAGNVVVFRKKSDG